MLIDHCQVRVIITILNVNDFVQIAMSEFPAAQCDFNEFNVMKTLNSVYPYIIQLDSVCRFVFEFMFCGM